MLQQIDFPELFFGFVAPIGVNTSIPIQSFRANLESVGYTVRIIKVTDIFDLLIKIIPPKTPLVKTPMKERFDSYISYGNQIRDEFDNDSILAAFSIFTITRQRQKQDHDPNDRFSKTAFILHQFKRKEEIELLRTVYGRLFFQVSVYSRRGARVDYLSRKFASSSNVAGANAYRSEAESIIKTDEDQENSEHGQKVSSIFHQADFILNVDPGKQTVNHQVCRFIELLFSSNKYSPTKMEYGMFAAKSAALRTLDLSRQVGAAIFSKNGEVISVGSNEVPKADGGTYWSDETFDDREFLRGFDSNDQRKSELLAELLEIVTNSPEEAEELKGQSSVKNAQFLDALEYGRVVHAEMGAICDAARTGVPVRASTLYSTTFPCHMCAKHIVSAGVAEVVFLEPYPKSLTVDLHSDSVEVERNDRGQFADYPSVKFIHFFGVTPRRYRELFERGKRKDQNGIFQEFPRDMKKPIVSIIFPFYSSFEEYIMESVKESTKMKFNIEIE